MSSRCGLTVTGTRTRYECFLRQLKAYGLVFYNTLHKLFYKPSNHEPRAQIRSQIQNPVARQRFLYEIQNKCSEINQVIHATLVPYLHLMGLERRQSPLMGTDYIPALWTFFTRIIYEKPVVLEPDSIDGTHVLYIQESFQWFICEQIQARHHKKTEEMM